MVGDLHTLLDDFGTKLPGFCKIFLQAFGSSATGTKCLQPSARILPEKCLLPSEHVRGVLLVPWHLQVLERRIEDSNLQGFSSSPHWDRKQPCLSTPITKNHRLVPMGTISALIVTCIGTFSRTQFEFNRAPTLGVRVCPRPHTPMWQGPLGFIWGYRV